MSAPKQTTESKATKTTWTMMAFPWPAGKPDRIMMLELEDDGKAVKTTDKVPDDPKTFGLPTYPTADIDHNNIDFLLWLAVRQGSGKPIKLIARLVAAFNDMVDRKQSVNRQSFTKQLAQLSTDELKAVDVLVPRIAELIKVGKCPTEEAIDAMLEQLQK
jgi:hypothetical protein